MSSIKEFLLRLRGLHLRSQENGIIRDVFKRHVNPNRRIVVDFSSPNLAKRFHVGNMRSTLIGRFIDSINRCAGHQVTSINYLGDWGGQMAVLAVAFPHFVDQEKWQWATDEEKIRILTDCYVWANKETKKNADFKLRCREALADMERQLAMGGQSSEHLRFWNDVQEISRRSLNETYRMMNVQFDQWSFESDFAQSANQIVDHLVREGFAKQNKEGLWTVHREATDREYAAIRKSDGSTLYLTRLVMAALGSEDCRELASILHRDEIYNADKYLYVVDSAQSNHFHSLKTLLTVMGKKELAEKVEHVSYGRVDGMSTREGTCEFVMDLYERGKVLAKQFIEKSETIKISPEQVDVVAENLARSSIAFDCLKRARRTNYKFSFENAYRMGQENALLLQMKHSRLCGIERQNGELLATLTSCGVVSVCDLSRPIIQLLEAFDVTILRAYSEMEPCQVGVYAVKLANCAGSAIAALRVQDESEKNLARSRLLILHVTKAVLAECMHLLGMEPLERM